MCYEVRVKLRKEQTLQMERLYCNNIQANTNSTWKDHIAI